MSNKERAERAKTIERIEKNDTRVRCRLFHLSVVIVFSNLLKKLLFTNHSLLIKSRAKHAIPFAFLTLCMILSRRVLCVSEIFSKFVLSTLCLLTNNKYY